jgi:hypothetical protein
VKRCLHRVVKVSWIDAEEEAGWNEYKKKPSWVIHTIGYLVELPKRKTDFMVLANSHLPDTNSWGGLNRIPKGMILSVETVLKSVRCGEEYDASSGYT